MTDLSVAIGGGLISMGSRNRRGCWPKRGVVMARMAKRPKGVKCFMVLPSAGAVGGTEAQYIPSQGGLGSRRGGSRFPKGPRRESGKLVGQSLSFNGAPCGAQEKNAACPI